VSAEKFLGGKGQKEHQDQEIAPISLPSFYQWRVRGCTGHALQRNAAPRAPRKK